MTEGIKTPPKFNGLNFPKFDGPFVLNIGLLFCVYFVPNVAEKSDKSLGFFTFHLFCELEWE